MAQFIFGLPEKERVAAQLRELADKIDRDEAILRYVSNETRRMVEEFEVSCLTVEYHEKK